MREYTLDADGIRCCIITKKDVSAGYETDEDEDEVDFYGYRNITKEEARVLTRQIEESDGFDVDELPHCRYIGLRRLSDMELQSDIKNIRSYADIAIQDYNTKQNTNLKVLKVVKANAEIVCGFIYYITFEANDPCSGRSATYQAKILLPIMTNDVKVLFCRPKPSSSSSNP